MRTARPLTIALMPCTTSGRFGIVTSAPGTTIAKAAKINLAGLGAELVVDGVPGQTTTVEGTSSICSSSAACGKRCSIAR